jgi:hypothetical protein
MKAILRRFSRWLLLAGLTGPAIVPGINLVELYATGSTDDYYEFCDAVDLPRFVFGAAKSCDLDLLQLLIFAALSYAGAIVVLTPAVVLTVLTFGAGRENLR